MKLDPFCPPNTVDGLAASTSGTITNPTMNDDNIATLDNPCPKKKMDIDDTNKPKRKRGENDPLINVGSEKLRQLDKIRRERKKKREALIMNNVASSSSSDATTKEEAASQDSSQSSSLLSSSSSTKKQQQRTTRGVIIAESSIRHKENTRYIPSLFPYLSYKIANVYLNLLVTLVSNNSLLSVSATRSIWNLLTGFGGRWRDWSLEYGTMTNKKKKKSRDNNKRRMIEKGDNVSSLQHRKGGHDDDDEEEVPENERPVPGMSGLSVEFVRDAFSFYNSHVIEEEEEEDDDENGDGGGGGRCRINDNIDTGLNTSSACDELVIEEGIYSDRLPSGR